MLAEFKFELTSKMPILFHADDVEQNDRLKAWRDNPANKSLFVPGDDRTPPWTWQTYLYFHDGHLGIPSEVVMKALSFAGAKVPIPGKGKLTFKGLSQSGLFIPAEHCEFLAAGKSVKQADIVALEGLTYKEQSDAVAAMDQGMRLFVKRAAVNGSKHVRVRLRVEEWQVRGVIHVLEPAITGEVLGQLFTIAGRYGGLLDWRPNSPKAPGPFGTFDASVTLVGASKRQKVSA